MQPILKPVDIDDHALATVMVSGIGRRQKRQEILRQAVQVPGGNEPAQSIQQVRIPAVAIPETQARDPAMFAHAAYDQKVGKAVT